MKPIISILLALACCATCLPCGAEDWPTYRHDSARSAPTGETLPAGLVAAWVYRSGLVLARKACGRSTGQVSLLGEAR